MQNKFIVILSIFIFSIFLSTIFLGGETEYKSMEKSQWNYVTDSPTTGGYGECAVSDGKYIYILRQWKAGYLPSFNKYDPVGNSWRDLSGSFPTVDFKNGVAITYDYEGNFYVLTGSAYADGSDRVEFYRYNISSDTWIKLADTPHVQGAGDAIIYSSYENIVYAFLGRAEYTGSYVPSKKSVFEKYDPQGNTWTLLNFPDWKGTDDGCSLAWTGGKYIYAFQGEYEENYPLRSFARYNIDMDLWENMSDVPAQDGVGDGGSLLWIGYYNADFTDYIFALDGNGCNETPSYNFSVYHITTNSWEKLDDLPYPVGYYVGNRLVYVNGKIYYWQGAPSSWDGGGKVIYSYEISQIPEISSDILFLTVPILLPFFRKKK